MSEGGSRKREQMDKRVDFFHNYYIFWHLQVAWCILEYSHIERKNWSLQTLTLACHLVPNQV